MALTTRGNKGSALTHNELDANFNFITGSQNITGSLTVSQEASFYSSSTFNSGLVFVSESSLGFTVSSSGTNYIKFLSASNLNVVFDQLPTTEVRVSGSLWISGSGVGSASGSKYLMVFNG